MMKKQKSLSWAPVSQGTALAQCSTTTDTSPCWGNIPEQIDEINEKHAAPATSRMWFWMKALKLQTV